MKVLLFFIVFSLLSFNSKAYNIDDLIASIENNKTETLSDAIALLPRNIRSHFTLAYEGHGLRGTSYLEPGVVAFDPDGSFYLTFGSPKKALGNEIEILQYNKQSKRAELFSLSFPLKRDFKGKIVRPESNPKKCLVCHGSDPKVLWGEYNDWSGFYGSSDHDKLSPVEANYFQEFKNYKKDEKPYSNLVFRPDPQSPYDQEYIEALRIHPGLSFIARPNSVIGLYASHINAQIIGRQILSSKKYKSLRLQVLYDLKQCWTANKYNITYPGVDGSKSLRKLGLENIFKTPFMAVADGTKSMMKLPGLVSDIVYKDLIKAGYTFTTRVKHRTPLDEAEDPFGFDMIYRDTLRGLGAYLTGHHICDETLENIELENIEND